MEKAILTIKEVKRVEVIQKAGAGESTVMETKELLGLSERQVYRLKGSFKLVPESFNHGLKGMKGLIHGNRGKASPRHLEHEISEKVVKLSKVGYEGHDDSFFTERLVMEEGIRISKEKVRQILLVQEREGSAANSPQAKGRIERLRGAFQDRLGDELKRFNAKTIDEANAAPAGL